MTQIAAAEAAGVHQSYYSKIERGAVVPSPSVAAKLAAVLNMDVRVILYPKAEVKG
jgi:transcriptional regulator with XRE-family HTH domain